MKGWASVLQENQGGIVAGVLVWLVLLGTLHWITYLYGWGRYNIGTGPGLGRRVSQLLTEIIKEFRHLLALLIVGGFGLTLVAVILAALYWYRGTPSQSGYDAMLKGIQVVVASLGGLVGSIIGYYFGESAAIKAQGGHAPAGGGPPPPARQEPGEPGQPGQPTAARLRPETPAATEPPAE